VKPARRPACRRGRPPHQVLIDECIDERLRHPSPGPLKLETSVPKERTKAPSKEGRGRQRKRSGLDDRERDSSVQIREKRGDTRIDTLRQTYGDSFAPGIRGDAHLKTLLDRTGSNSLSDYLKATGQSNVSGKDKEGGVDEKASDIRYASDQQFREAHRKTSALHAGLFRRLAE
jgi:hypothetical protein